MISSFFSFLNLTVVLCIIIIIYIICLIIVYIIITNHEEVIIDLNVSKRVVSEYNNLSMETTTKISLLEFSKK